MQATTSSTNGALSRRSEPRARSFRALTIIDGFVCCGAAPGANWCGQVHGDPLEAMLCIQKARHAAPPRCMDDPLLRWVFRGQSVEHADGHIEVQAIRRSQHNIPCAYSYLSFEGSLEKEIPGFQGRVFRETKGPSGRPRRVVSGPDVYARNIELLKAEIARRGRDRMLALDTVYVDASGREYSSLARLERDNARKAKSAPATFIIEDVRPALPVRRRRQAKRVA